MSGPGPSRAYDDGLAEGFAACEALVVAGLQALAEVEDAKAAKFAPQGINREGHETRAACLREMALAVSLGQFRTSETNERAVISAHRAAANRDQSSAGGKASAGALTPEQRKERARTAARERWGRRLGKVERALSRGPAPKPGTKK